MIFKKSRKFINLSKPSVGLIGKPKALYNMATFKPKGNSCEDEENEEAKQE